MRLDEDSRSVFSGSERRSVAQGSHVSAVDSWKEFCHEKQQRMRGRRGSSQKPREEPNLSSLQYRPFPAAPSDARSEASRPEWQSAYSTSPPSSPPLGATSPPPEPEALDMPLEEFTAFIVSELQRATRHQRFHPGLALVYRVGTGF